MEKFMRVQEEADSFLRTLELCKVTPSKNTALVPG